MIFKNVEIIFYREVKEEVDFSLSDFINMFVLPFWVLIFVNQQGTDSFEKFRMMHEPLRHFELHLKHVMDAHLAATFYLLEYNSHR